jgi:hypothetical protein
VASGGNADYLNLTTGPQPTSFTIGSQTLSISLPSPGLLIANGQVEALNASLTGNLGVAGAGLKMDGLTVDYTAAAGGNPDYLNLTGSTTFTVASQVLSIALPGTGLLIENNELASMDASFTGNLGVAGAGLKMDGLTVDYTPAAGGNPDRLNLTGSTTFTVASQVLSIALPGTGLLIQNNELVSMDASFTGNLGVAGAGLKMDGLTVSYTAAAGGNPDRLNLTGSSSFTVASQSLSIALPGTGLLIENNDLVSLDAALTGELGLAGAGLKMDGLTVVYVASTDTLQLTGASSLSVGSDSLTVTTLNDGILISNGSVVQASANVTAQFTLLSLSIAPDLTFAYDADDETCVLWGSLQMLVGSATINASVNKPQPLVIRNGDWDIQSLDFDLNGRFDLFGLTVDADNLALTYAKNASGGSQYTIGGQIGIPDLFNATAQIGTASQPGIIITNGNWDIVSLTVGLSDVHLGAFTLQEFQFSIVNNSFGGVDAEVSLPGGLEIDGDIQFENHHIQEVALSAENARIPIGDTGLFLTGIGAKVDNIYAGDLTVSGNISVALGDPVTIAGHTAAIVTATGSFTVDSGELDLTAQVEVLGGYIASGTGHVVLNWGMGDYRADVSLSVYDGVFNVTGGMDFNSDHVFSVWGQADLRVPKDIPIIGGKSLPAINFAGKYDPHGDQFVAAWTEISILSHDIWAGVEYDFQKDKLELIGHKSIEAITSNVQPDPQNYYQSDSFTFPATATGGSFEATWTGDISSPPIYFRDPGWGGAAQINMSSSIQTLTDPTRTSSQSYTIRLVQDRMTPTSAAFLVSPAGSSAPYALMPAGNYIISVQVPSSGQVNEVTIAGHFMQPTPTIALSALAPSFNSYTLTSTFQTAAPGNSSISFYYSYDPAGYVGTPIATISPLPDSSSYFAPTTTAYAWDVADLPATPIYVYAVINDGANPVQLSSYLSAPIIPQPPLSVEMQLQDAPDEDLEGWLVVVTDASGNVIQRSTNLEGKQGFDIAAGTYSVTVRGHSPAYVAQPTAGQIVTADGGLSQTVTITDPGDQSMEANFSFLKQSEISGRIFQDLSASGVYALADPGLKGWTVYADANDNGQYDIGETCATTDANGAYRLYFTPPPTGQTDTYVVREVLPSAWWALESPAAGYYTVTLTQQDGQPAPSSSGNDFLDVGLVTFGGEVYDDANQNGLQDPGEPGLPGQTVSITTSGGGTAAAPATDADGAYAVTTDLDVDVIYDIAPSPLASGATVTYPVSKVFQFGSVFEPATFSAYNNAGSERYYGITTGDFNGDGLTDEASMYAAVASNVYAQDYIDISLWNTSWNQFAGGTRVVLTSNPQKMATQLLAADLDHDGVSELIIVSDPGIFQIWHFANGSGDSLTHTVVYTSGSLAGGTDARLSLADLNGDGYQDLLCNGGYGWINDHTGKFAVTSSTVLPVPSMTGATFTDAVAFDFSGSGNPGDLAIGYVNSQGVATVSIYLHTDPTVPSYLHSQDVALTGQSFGWLGTADFDHNGYADIIATASDPSGASFQNSVFFVANDAMVMGIDQSWMFTQPSLVGSLAIGDVDANGYADILWSARQSVTALLNQGRDYFSVSTANSYNPTNEAEPSWFVPIVAVMNNQGGPLPNIMVEWNSLLSPASTTALLNLTAYQSASRTADNYVVMLDENGPQPGYNFGIFGLAAPAGPSIGGLVYSDVNENQVQDLREGGLVNVAVQLVSKATDAVVDTTSTDQSGMFRFDGVAAGEYLVQLAGLSLVTTAPSAPYDVVVSGTQALGGYNFGVHLPGSEGAGIQGTIYDDVNGDGNWNPAAANAAENGIARVLVYLDLNGNGQLDPGDPCQRTTSQGTYFFGGFRPGLYQVRYVTPNGYVPSGAAYIQQKVGAGETECGADLGVTQAPPVAGFGDAVTFDGSTSYIEVSSSLNNRSNWTFSAWIKPVSTGNMIIYSEGDPNITLSIDVTTQQAVHVGAWRSDVTGNWVNFSTAAGVVQVNQWNFIAVTLESGGVQSGALTVYANGGVYSGSLQAVSDLDTIYAAIGRNIGSLHGGNESASSFAGTIDEVRLWDVARSLADIQGDYMRTIPSDTLDLLAYWRLDDGSGTNAWNEVGFNSGTLNGAADWAASTAPVSYSLNAGASVSGVLFGAVPDGNNLTFKIVGQPSHGAIVLDAQTGQFVYTPTAGWSGSDSFAFSVINDQGAASANTYPVTLTVRPVGQIGAGQARVLSFVDADGTLVNVSLNRGNASVYFAGTDISMTTRRGVCSVAGSDLRVDSIVLRGDTRRATLSISARGGIDKLTTVGSITGGSLHSLHAPNVIVMGEGLNLSGNVDRINLRELRNSQILVGGDLGYLQSGALSGSQVSIGGNVRGSIRTDTFYDTVFAVGVGAGPDGVYFTADDTPRASGGSINELHIGWYNSDNQLRPQGVIAQSIKTVKVGRHRLKMLPAPSAWHDGDMQIMLVRRTSEKLSGSSGRKVY